MYKIIISAFFLIVVILLSILIYLDTFSTITIEEKPVGPYKLVYENHKGAYNGIKEVQDKIYYSLQNDKINTTKGFGIYYDNPNEVPVEKLRSIGGCIVEINDYNHLKSSKNKYLIKDYYYPKNIYTEFSLKSPLSILIGIFKVYPKINEYQKKHNYNPQPVMEIYDIPANKIIYSVPIS